MSATIAELRNMLNEGCGKCSDKTKNEEAKVCPKCKKDPCQCECTNENIEGETAETIPMEESSEIADLRAIAAGFDPILVECYGGSYLLAEGAMLQGMSITFSGTMKSAKQHMKTAKKCAKDGRKADAVREYNAAITDLKTLQKQAQEIDDDHIVMVGLDAFIKTFIPLMAGLVVNIYLTPTVMIPVTELVFAIGAWCCGMSKSLDFSAAVEKKLTTANKQGRNGTADPSTWWKVGATRGEVMIKLDRLITACEKAKDAA